jgi:hypothetical protein
MKKFLILMLALVCAFAMFACGDDPVIPGPDGGDKVPTELNIDEFVAAVNASSPKTAEIKVKMENALGTLNAEYDVVYTGDGAAAVNYTREVFNEIGAEELKSTVTGIAAITKDGAIDSQALGATGSVVMTKLNLQLDKMTASKDGSVLTATVSAANTAEAAAYQIYLLSAAPADFFFSTIKRTPMPSSAVPISLTGRFPVSPKQRMASSTVSTVLDLSMGTTLFISPMDSALK